MGLNICGAQQSLKLSLAFLHKSKANTEHLQTIHHNDTTTFCTITISSKTKIHIHNIGLKTTTTSGQASCGQGHDHPDVPYQMTLCKLYKRHVKVKAECCKA